LETKKGLINKWSSNDFSVTRFTGSDYSAVLPMISFLFIMGFTPSSLAGLLEKENYLEYSDKKRI
jgi:hypothetical protein